MESRHMGKCAICLDAFHDPRVLPCGHTFCFSCIQPLSPKIRCPKCRKDHKVAVKDLPKNYDVCEIAVNASQCCIKHKEVLKYWCSDCSASICGDCLLVGEHTHHKFTSVADVLPQMKKEFITKANQIERCKKEAIHVQEIVRNMLTQEERNYMSTFQAIRDTYDRVITEIELERAQVLACLTAQHERFIQTLQCDADSLETYLQNLNRSESITKQALVSCEPSVLAAHVGLKIHDVPVAPKKMVYSVMVNNISALPCIEVQGRITSNSPFPVFVFSRVFGIEKLQVCWEDTVSHLKVQLETRWGIRAVDTILMQGFDGSELCDRKTLIECNIRNNDTLILESNSMKTCRQ